MTQTETEWRPFDPSADAVNRSARAEREGSCNIHRDCAAADERARAQGRLNADHCSDPCCEDCFGS